MKCKCGLNMDYLTEGFLGDHYYYCSYCGRLAMKLYGGKVLWKKPSLNSASDCNNGPSRALNQDKVG